jgi:menaquinone-specific isochorismate synthase
MLKQAGLVQENLAWLRHAHKGRALSVRAWAAEARGGELSFFAPDFALSASQPWLVGDACAWPEVVAEPLPSVLHRAEPSSADFERLHEEILARIARHEFAKVVPIVCEELEFAEPLRVSHLARALSVVENQYSYGFAFGGEGLAGITPELLFEVEGDRLQTMALAGTGAFDGPPLLEDRKERREHDLVIEHISSELQDWGELTVGTTEERRFGALKHLYTPLSLRLNRAPSFMELVVRLHPTAALGGWPRQPAVEWLQRQKFHVGRRRFGAPFGWSDGEHMQCVVAIRGLQWQDRHAWLSAGCGVVEGSQALREWRELAMKRAATSRHLGLEL